MLSRYRSQLLLTMSCRGGVSTTINLSSISMRIGELMEEKQPKENVVIQGWAYRVQRYGKMLFLKLNDGQSSHMLQAVVPRNIIPTVVPGSAIKLLGRWIPSQGQEQDMEFLTEKCIFLGKMEELMPAGDNDALRKIPHLRLKKPEFAAIFRIRSRLNHLAHKFFYDRAFVHMDTPIFSQNDCEGAGEAFGVICPDETFFEGTKPYLPVSAQLHLEALTSSITHVYTLSPSFRTNRSSSRQHMAEFRMLEAECAFMDSVDQLCTLVEEFLCYMTEAIDSREMANDIQASEPICQRSGPDFASQVLSKCLANRLNKPLPRITFIEAIKILGRPLEDRKPLNKRDEMNLVNWFQGPLFVTHFPSQQKAFYMRRTMDEEFTESFDLLAPFVGELAGGSVREWDPILLAARLGQKEQNEDVGKLNWYLDLRRRGYPRSVGFGIGMDRLMQSLLGIVNIKDTIPFPRSFNLAIKC